MKKLLLIVTVAAGIGMSAFGQGQFNFSTASRMVWDDWSALAIKADGSNNVAFLFGTGTRLIDAVAAQTATNATGIPNGASVSTVWNDLLTDPNYHLATNTVTGNTAVDFTTATGGASGSTFVATNSPSSGTITVFVIGWSAAFANPVAAAAAGGVVGWSAAFTYTIGQAGGAVAQPFTTAPNAMVAFGVVPVPEPTTFALAGLGAATLLIFRRRKQ